jgi:YbbR domain-containing protein
LAELRIRFIRGRFARLAFVDVLLRLVAIVCAIVVCVLLYYEQDTERTVDCDVLTILPERTSTRELASALPANVRVTLRGPRSKVEKLERHSESILVPLDLRGQGSGAFTFDPTAVAVPRALRVVRIEPSSVRVRWRDPSNVR